MAPQTRIRVTSTDWITPSEPTPVHRRLTPLSDWDVVMFKSYTPLLLFYTNNDNLPDFMNTQLLKCSLSEVLTDFYPLAGRLRDIGLGRDEIDNNDAGVLFIEAEYRDELNKYKRNGYLPSQMDYHHMFPIHFYSSSQDPLLGIQITRFMDGGVALSMMMLHKIADMYSVSYFLDAWAKKTRDVEYEPALFNRRLIEFPMDTVISDEAIAHYREDHRVSQQNECHLVRMDPNQQKYAKTSANGPMPLKSVILEFHATGLQLCKKDAHTEEMIASKKWLSTKDTLFAMLIRAIIRCRQMPEDVPIKMKVSVNGRSKMKNNREMDYYFGNWMVSQDITYTLQEVEETNMAHTAITFRQQMNKIKAPLFHSISKIYTLHEDMTVNYLNYHLNSHVQSTANDVSMLPFWSSDFGYGIPDRTRSYITFGGNGCMIIFSRGDNSHGPIYDVQLQLDANSMRRFIDDPDIQKYTAEIHY
ncbi:transferase [Pilobolus umbonatus]|nr:transferase [Pilobolus umbonatus]